MSAERQAEPLRGFTVGEAGDDLFAFAASDKPRLPLGYSLDDTCGRIGLGEMGLLWARSGAGKTTFVMNVIANTPDSPTVVFNLENTARRQYEWLLAMTFPLSTQAKDIEDVLRAGEEHPQFNEIREAADSMKYVYPDLHFISPAKAPTVNELQVTVWDIEAQTGVRPVRVFIDHLTLLKGARDYEGVTTMAAELHQWAMDEDLAVVCLQQTGRGGFDGGRNDGHIPVTLSSGLYAGEHDADWIWGMYRPDRDPRFKKQRWDFKKEEDYLQMLRDRDAVQCQVYLQLIKNRPYGELKDMGIVLHYDNHSRRLLDERTTFSFGGK
jgi:replicative DNA helicase